MPKNQKKTTEHYYIKPKDLNHVNTLKKNISLGLKTISIFEKQSSNLGKRIKIGFSKTKKYSNFRIYSMGDNLQFIFGCFDFFGFHIKFD